MKTKELESFTVTEIREARWEGGDKEFQKWNSINISNGSNTVGKQR